MRDRIPRPLRLLLIFLLCLFAPSLLTEGCGSNTAHFSRLPPLPKEEEITVGLAGDLSSLHPLLPEGAAKEEVLNALFHPLWTWDEEWGPVSDFLEELPQTSKDGLSTTFSLRTGQKWDDGTPITAYDVLYTQMVLAHPNMMANSPYSSEMEKRVRGLKILSPYSFQVLWKEVYLAPALGFPWVLPSKALKPFIERDLEGFLRSPLISRYPVGNGPFQVFSWERISGSSIPYKARIACSRSRKGSLKGELSRIVFLLYKSERDLLSALISGEVDLTPSLSRESLREVSRLKKFTIDWRAGEILEAVWFNVRDPALQNPLTREALFLSVRRDLILKRTWGTGDVARSWLPPLHPFSSQLFQAQGDPLKAKALLSRAGWEAELFPLGEDKRPARRGVLKSKKGLPLALSLLYLKDDPVQALISRSLAEEWRPLGISVSLLPASPEEHESRKNEGKFQLLIATTPITPDISPKELFSSRSKRNVTGWKLEENDRVCQEILTKPEARERLFHRQQELVAENVPMFPIFFRPRLTVSRTELLGIKGRGTGPVTWNCEEWSWRK